MYVFPVLGAAEMDAGLQMRSHQSGGEGQYHLPPPAGHASFEAAEHRVDLLGCECTLMAHVQLFMYQYPQVFFVRADLDPFILQLVLVLGVAPTQRQDLALGLVEPHEVHMGPPLQLVQVSLDGILRRVDRSTQLGVICKLAAVALDPTVCVLDEDTKEYWSQYRLLRNTTCH